MGTRSIQASLRTLEEEVQHKQRHAAHQRAHVARNPEQEKQRNSDNKAKAVLNATATQLEAWREKRRISMARLRETRKMEGVFGASSDWFKSVEDEMEWLCDGYEECDATLLLDDFIL